MDFLFFIEQVSQKFKVGINYQGRLINLRTLNFITIFYCDF